MLLCSYACGKSFRTAQQVSKHRSSCNSGPIAARTCSKCNRVLSTIGNLRKHDKTCSQTPSMNSSSSISSPISSPIISPNSSSNSSFNSSPNSSPNSSSISSSSNRFVPLDHLRPFTSPSGHQTRIDVGFQSPDIQQIERDLSGERETPESTRRKNEWVSQLLERFCEKMPSIISANSSLLAAADSSSLVRCEDELEAWHPETLRIFLCFLSHNGYATSSIQDVIGPALKRIYQNLFNQKMPENISLVINTTIRQIIRDKPITNSGKAPALLSDVRYIINRIPNTRPLKNMEASLFLFAVNVGARALTCDGVRICDIRSVQPSEISGLHLVQVRLMVTKGNPQWNHLVSIEGSLTNAADDDAVYWLNTLMFNYHKLPLEHFSTWREAERENTTKLWHFSKDSMREHFKKCSIYSGYPALLFAFHSLRAGFMCSALCNSNSNQRTGTLENTGLIAGWKIGGAAQLCYVKRAAKAALVASRLLQPGATSITSQLLMEPTHFHDITLGPVLWPKVDIYKNLIFQLKDCLREEHPFPPDVLPSELTQFIKVTFQRILSNYVKAKPALESEAARVYKEIPRWKISRYRTTIEMQTRQPVARMDLMERLEGDESLIPDLIVELLDLLDPAYVESRKRIQKSPEMYSIQRSAKSEKTASPHRKRRRPWMDFEDKILTDGVEQNRSWIEISQKLVERTNGDCKDRWRNLQKGAKTVISSSSRHQQQQQHLHRHHHNI